MALYFYIAIMGENGTTIYQWSRTHFHLNVVTVKTLNPGEQLKSVYPWQQEYDDM